MKKWSKAVQTVLRILQDEVNGDSASALTKMTDDYTMTWVDAGIDGKQLFPTTKRNLPAELEEAYAIKGRQYEVRNIAEGSGVVFVELVESFPNQKTGNVYRTPLVLVLEMKGGKIRTGRHYLDPRLAKRYLTRRQVAKAFKGGKEPLMAIR